MNNNGWTALHHAAYNGKEAMVEQLLRAKANPDAVDNDGDTAARLADLGGYHALAQRLMKAQAKP